MAKPLVTVKDPWKGILLVILGIALAVSSFLIPFDLFLPAWMREDDSYVIKPRERMSFSIDLMLGSVVRGMLVISGGDGSIGFSLEDSSGRTVIAEETVRDGYVYEFQPDKRDSYVLLLDNSGDSAEKSVHWVVWVYYYNSLFVLSGTAFSLAGIFAVVRKERIMSSKVAESLEEASETVNTSLKRKPTRRHRSSHQQKD